MYTKDIVNEIKTVFRRYYRINMKKITGENVPYTVPDLYRVASKYDIPMKDFLYGEVEVKPKEWNKYQKAVNDSLIDLPLKAGKPEINDRFNKYITDKFEQTDSCPNCGNPINWKSMGWGGDDNYCKHCGIKLRDFGNDFDPVRLGKNLKKARLERGLYIEDVIKEIAFKSPSSLSLWERGKTLPLPHALFFLAKLYDRSMEELINPLAEGEGKERAKEIRFQETEDDARGYEWFPDKFDDYVPVCPCCGEVVDLTQREALSISMELFEDTRQYSKRNDGAFCKNCGQRLSRKFKGKNFEKNAEILMKKFEAAPKKKKVTAPKYEYFKM